MGYHIGPISCKKQGIRYIKSYVIIDLGSLNVIWLQTCNNFILGWELLGWQDKAEQSLLKSVIFCLVALKAKERHTKLHAEMLY